MPKRAPLTHPYQYPSSFLTPMYPYAIGPGRFFPVYHVCLSCRIATLSGLKGALDVHLPCDHIIIIFSIQLRSFTHDMSYIYREACPRKDMGPFIKVLRKRRGERGQRKTIICERPECAEIIEKLAKSCGFLLWMVFWRTKSITRVIWIIKYDVIAD